MIYKGPTRSRRAFDLHPPVTCDSIISCVVCGCCLVFMVRDLTRSQRNRGMALRSRPVNQQRIDDERTTN